MHINYFETHYHLEEAFDLAREIGFDGIEVRDRDRSGAMPLEDYLALTRRLVEESGLGITYGCRVDTTHPGAAVREQSLAHFIRVIEFAGELGVTTLNAFTGPLYLKGGRHSECGSALATQEHYDEAARMFRQAASVAAKYGITLCLETHNGYMHDLAAPAARVVDYMAEANIRVNYDQGNIGINDQGETFEEAISILGSRIGYVHLKNMSFPSGGGRDEYIRTTLAGGDINHFALLRKLFATGYQGLLCIENIMRGDKYPAAIEDLAYLRSVLHRLG